MSPIKSATPEAAHVLLQDGYSYIDVRNELEFELGHVAGAFNIPLTLQTDFGPEPNERFVDVVKQHFGAEARIVVGCAMGVRSGKAARLLMDAGYTNVVEQKSGFDGSRDAFGRKSPGWRDCKLPLELGQPPDRSYAALQRESPK